jgi:DUF4097 and DUF4098 domain-containing protein YvlB
MRHVLRLALLATVLPATVAAQQTDDEWLRNCDRNDERLVSFCDVRVQSLGGLSALDVDASPNGGVQIVAWDRADVEVHSRIQARARDADEARALADRIDVLIDGGRIGSDGPESERNASWHVSFVVFVPARIDVTAESVNGPMSVAGVTGRMDLRTVNGPLSLRDVAGDVQARTQNGPLSIRLAGSRWNGDGLDAETSNGPLTLEIPDGYNARLETGTVNGPMTSDVPLSVRFNGRRSQRIEATLGDGGAPVRAVTTNGPVTIRAR